MTLRAPRDHGLSHCTPGGGGGGGGFMFVKLEYETKAAQLYTQTST